MNALATVEAYFAAARAGDAGKISDVFAEDAWVQVMGNPKLQGRSAIADFYRENFAKETPNPKTSPPDIDGQTVTVNIELMIQGSLNLIEDVFTVVDGQIISLDVRLRDG